MVGKNELHGPQSAVHNESEKTFNEMATQEEKVGVQKEMIPQTTLY